MAAPMVRVVRKGGRCGLLANVVKRVSSGQDILRTLFPTDYVLQIFKAYIKGTVARLFWFWVVLFFWGIICNRDPDTILFYFSYSRR
jgi:hypothetical protein